MGSLHRAGALMISALGYLAAAILTIAVVWLFCGLCCLAWIGHIFLKAFKGWHR